MEQENKKSNSKNVLTVPGDQRRSLASNDKKRKDSLLNTFKSLGSHKWTRTFVAIALLASQAGPAFAQVEVNPETLSCGSNYFQARRWLTATEASGLDLDNPAMMNTIGDAIELAMARASMAGDCPSGCSRKIVDDYTWNYEDVVELGENYYSRDVRAYVTVRCEEHVNGCTDVGASNYNAGATQEDGSCLYWVYGCTDSSATNYNVYANINDGSCTYTVYGCTDILANNYNSSATIDDGSCSYTTYCTDPLALNFNAEGSCVYE